MTHLVHVLDRHERQRKARAVRRELAEITLDNSKLQEQSLLFSKIPAEIRFLIFQFLLSQTYDYNRPVDVHSISPLYRPGHTHRTKIHTAILLTCRLVYFEAHSIPIRSATHHFRHLGSTSWLYEGDVWLHHMTKQRGAEVYHLHDNLVALKEGNFTKFFLPHLHWKRVTWTICSYLWPPILAGYREIDRLAKTLADIDLPASCQEVTLEFEVREDVPEFCEDLQRQAELCMKIGMLSSKLSNEQAIAFALPLLNFLQVYGGPMGPFYNLVPITRRNTHGLAAVRLVGGLVHSFGTGTLSGTAPSGCAGEPTHRDERI
jgi:hypothetical protein